MFLSVTAIALMQVPYSSVATITQKKCSDFTCKGSVSPEEQFWCNVKDSKRCSDFDSYLSKFGDSGICAAQARSKKCPTDNTFVVSLKGNVKLVMVKLSGGTFTMGTDNSRYNDEKPAHQVRVPSFTIGQTEITQAQWKAVMDDQNPSKFKGENLPVEQVSWDQAVEFCQRLSKKTRFKFRLPTEAEWEYACRAGTQTEYSFGSNRNVLDQYAWHAGNSDNKTHPVGIKQANRFNLLDMLGNVWEWCSDRYSENYYAELSRQGVIAVNPQGPRTGTERVVRGGSWGFDENFHSSRRNRHAPSSANESVGFRVACTKTP